MALAMPSQVLRKAENLYRSGLQRDAIELLEEHLHATPEDVQAANILGRIYAHEKQPENAEYWFKIALQVESQGGTWNLNKAGSVKQEIDESDLEYIEGCSVPGPEVNLEYEYGFDPSEPMKKIEQCNEFSPTEYADENKPQCAEENAVNDDEPVSLDDLEFLFDEDEQANINENEQELDTEWQEYALLDDDFSDFDPRTPDDDVVEEAPLYRLSDLDKARQIASKIGEYAGWLENDIEPLMEVLAHHRSHGKTREALISLMLEEEATPHEISVIHDVRVHWGGAGYDRQYYWGKPCDGWPNISWKLSLAIMRQVKAESSDEIFIFVQDCFEDWSETASLLNAFPAFKTYLAHVVDKMALVSQACGQRMPPFVDYALFPDEESCYEFWWGYEHDTALLTITNEGVRQIWDA